MNARSYLLAAILLATSAQCAIAQRKYDSRATDTEIKIGNTMPYSDPVSAYSNIGNASFRTKDS
jgi:branched-chain amino acid transport system substrate-binding protein